MDSRLQRTILGPQVALRLIVYPRQLLSVRVTIYNSSEYSSLWRTNTLADAINITTLSDLLIWSAYLTGKSRSFKWELGKDALQRSLSVGSAYTSKTDSSLARFIHQQPCLQ